MRRVMRVAACALVALCLAAAAAAQQNDGRNLAGGSNTGTIRSVLGGVFNAVSSTRVVNFGWYSTSDTPQWIWVEDSPIASGNVVRMLPLGTDGSRGVIAFGSFTNLANNPDLDFIAWFDRSARRWCTVGTGSSTAILDAVTTDNGLTFALLLPDGTHQLSGLSSSITRNFATLTFTDASTTFTFGAPSWATCTTTCGTAVSITTQARLEVISSSSSSWGTAGRVFAVTSGNQVLVNSVTTNLGFVAVTETATTVFNSQCGGAIPACPNLRDIGAARGDTTGTLYLFTTRQAANNAFAISTTAGTAWTANVLSVSDATNWAEVTKAYVIDSTNLWVYMRTIGAPTSSCSNCCSNCYRLVKGTFASMTPSTKGTEFGTAGIVQNTNTVTGMHTVTGGDAVVLGSYTGSAGTSSSTDVLSSRWTKSVRYIGRATDTSGTSNAMTQIGGGGPITPGTGYVLTLTTSHMFVSSDAVNIFLWIPSLTDVFNQAAHKLAYWNPESSALQQGIALYGAWGNDRVFSREINNDGFVADVIASTQTSNTVVFGGMFDYVGTTAVAGVATWTFTPAATSITASPAAIGGGLFKLDTSLRQSSSSAKHSGLVAALAYAGNGDLYAGGLFDRNSNFDCLNNFAVLRSGASAFTDTYGGCNAQVHALATIDNTVFIGGAFTSCGGFRFSGIARFQADVSGTTNPWMGGFVNNAVNFNQGVAGNVRVIYPYGTGVLAGGEFTSVAGRATGNVRLAYWNGGQWEYWASFTDGATAVRTDCNANCFDGNQLPRLSSGTTTSIYDIVEVDTQLYAEGTGQLLVRDGAIWRQLTLPVGVTTFQGKTPRSLTFARAFANDGVIQGSNSLVVMNRLNAPATVGSSSTPNMALLDNQQFQSDTAGMGFDAAVFRSSSPNSGGFFENPAAALEGAVFVLF